MENATKALLIAGGVLITIAIIALGLNYLNSTSGSIDQGKATINVQETMDYNLQFQQYEGTQKGSAVKALIRLVQQNNINVRNNNGIKNGIKITYDSKTIDSDATQDEYTSLLSKINVTKSYSVKMQINSDAYISEIQISEK